MDVSREQNFSDAFKLRAKVYYHAFGNTLDIYRTKTFSTINSNSTTVGPKGAGNGARTSAFTTTTKRASVCFSDWAVTKNHQLNFSFNMIDDNHKNQSNENYPWENT